ncbi:MAG: PepSY domain-containing protein [Dehalococcoidia bacterium]
MAEAATGPDTDNIQDECGPQDEGDDAGETHAPAGKLDDGADLLPQAGITVNQAVAAAQGAATGELGEVDLEDYQGTLVFNVDIGDKDVKVDASNGSVVSALLDD